MKKTGYWKRRICVMLVAFCMLTNTYLPYLSVQAAETIKTEKFKIQNELYKGKNKSINNNDEDENGQGRPGVDIAAAISGESFSNLDSLAAYVSEYMVKGAKQIVVKYTGAGYETFASESKIKTELMPMVFAVDNATTSDADYLFTSYDSVEVEYVIDTANKWLKITMTPTYQETAEETEEVDEMVDNIIREIGISATDKTIDKVTKVYQWVKDNLTPSTSGGFTAYSALKNGTVKDIAYAALNYKILNKLGIRCAIIRGYENGNLRVWNLVKCDSGGMWAWYSEDIYADDRDGSSGNAILTGAVGLNVTSDYADYESVYIPLSEEDYQEEDGDITVTPVDNRLKGITASYQPQSKLKLNQVIKKSDIRVVAEYKDGTYKDVFVFSIDKTRITDRADNKITVTYMGYTASFTVDVDTDDDISTGDVFYIKFDTSGGSAPKDLGGEAVQVAKNEVIRLYSGSLTVKRTPTSVSYDITTYKDGYVFKGWYLDGNNFSTKCPSEFTITGNITLTAKWEENTLSAIKARYKGGIIKLEEHMSLEPVTDPDTGEPVLDADGNQVWEEVWNPPTGTIKKSDIEVIAYYSDGTTEILGESDFSIDPEIITHSGSTKVLVTASNKSNPQSTRSDTIVVYGENAIVTPDNRVDPVGDTYTVTFFSNYNATSFKIEGIPKYGRITKDRIEELYREGYSFEGWFTDKNGGTKFTEYTRITEDLSLYAHWTKKKLVRMSVGYFGPKVAVGQNVDRSNIIVSAYYSDYSMQEITGGKNLTRPGDYADQTGFTITKEGENKFDVIYTEDNPDDPTSPIKLQGSFTVEGYVAPPNMTYRVSFDTDGGTVIPNITGITKGDTIKLPEDPIKTGYVFAGWYKDSNFITEFKETDAITGDTTLYAKWIPFVQKPTVLMAGYIGEGLEKGAKIPKNEIRVLADCNDGSRIEITEFTYAPTIMHTSETQTKVEVKYQDDINDVDLSCVLYINAGEAGKTYTITYDTMGGDALESTTGIKWGSKVALPAPTKTGDTFLGWYTSKSYEKEFTSDTFIISDVTLYAKWEGTSDPDDPDDPDNPDIKGASLTANYLGDDITVGKSVSKSNVEVILTKEDGTKETVTDFKLTNAKITATGKNVVIVKYKKLQTTILVNGVKGTDSGNNNNNNNSKNTNTSKTNTKKDTETDKTKQTSTNQTSKKDQFAEKDNEIKDAQALQMAVADLVAQMEKAMRESGATNSDALREKIAQAVELLNSLNRIEKEEVEEQTLNDLNDLVLMLSNITQTIDNRLTDVTLNEEDVKGLGLLLEPKEIRMTDPIELIFTAIDKTPGGTDKDLMEQYAAITGQTIFKYMDLSVIKKIKEDRSYITDGNNYVKLTMGIPEEYQGKPLYRVLRNHEGTIEQLNDMDFNPNTITFKTDKFSLYAMTYEGEAAPVPSDTEVVQPDETNATDESSLVVETKKNTSPLFIILAAAAVIVVALGIILFIIMKEREDKEEQLEDLEPQEENN